MEDSNDDHMWEEIGMFTNASTLQIGNSLISSVSSSLCKHCGDARVTVMDGLFTCSTCSTVVDRIIDYGAEWRYYGAESDRNAVNTTRCCPPANSLIPTIGSVMHYTNHGRQQQTGMRVTILLNNDKTAVEHAATVAASPPTTTHKQDPFMHVQKYQMWNAMTYRERTLCSVFEQLSLVALQHGIPQIILEEAKSLYKRASLTKVTRGDNRKALIACSMYMACKLNKVPRSSKEIAEIFGMDSRILTRGYKLFQEAIDMEIETSTPEDYIRRFCSRLKMDPTELFFTEQIVQRANDMEIVCDFIPTSVASGAIYMSNIELKIGMQKKDVAQVCHISQLTMLKCYKRLVEYRTDLLNGLGSSS